MPVDEPVKTWAEEKERCSNGNDPSSPSMSHHTVAAGKENAVACQTQTDGKELNYSFAYQSDKQVPLCDTNMAPKTDLFAFEEKTENLFH